MLKKILKVCFVYLKQLKIIKIQNVCIVAELPFIIQNPLFVNYTRHLTNKNKTKIYENCISYACIIKADR